MIRFPLCFHPAMAITNSFKQCHGFIIAHLGAKEFLANDLTSVSIAKVCCPKEETKLRSNQAHATLSASIATVRPPLALRRGEADHIEDEGVHDFEAGGEPLGPLKEQ
jgi:hypothetical protein